MSSTPTKQPKIIGYMGALYEAFRQNASELPVDSARPDEKFLVWQGRLIETCTSVGIPQGYYKRVIDTLRSLGCIEMLVRGTRGSTQTTLALRHPPTLEAYEDAIVKSGWQGLTEAVSLDTLAADVRNLQQRIGGIDWLAINKNFEDRLQGLETAVKELQQQLSSTNKSSTNQ